MNPLILDTDGGVDDAQALMMLLAGGRAPVAITTVFGNVPLDQATHNVLAVLGVMGAEVPVHAGAAQPLVQPPVHATAIHGEDGLGGAPRPATVAGPAAGHAVTLLIEAALAAAQAGGRIDLLAIGPLTNIALALSLEPQITAGLGQVTIMGGTLNGRGNVTPAAEFNIYADPEAAAVVFRAPLDLVLVPWEVCVAHDISGARMDALLAAATPGPQRDFAAALAAFARNGIAQRTGRDVFHNVDTLAAAICADPGMVTREVRASIDVALAPGLTRGMTVVDPSGRLGTPPVRIVETVDPERLEAAFARSLG